MSPDDPRHGTRVGANSCKLGEPRPDGRPRCCEPCRLARNAYERQRLNARIRGVPGFAPSVGLQRRMRALCAIGYTQRDLARRLGITLSGVTRLVAGGGMERGTHWQLHRRIVRLYDQLSMTPGPSDLARIRAAGKGWPPPLAWDDDQLDDPAATPTGMPGRRDTRLRARADAELVRRALSGEKVTGATWAERLEVWHRWTQAGGHGAALDRINSWNLARDRALAERQAAA